ncbi:hypothetical protein DEA98_29365 (plasmid) [Brucella pseudogrignonensis]|nr:hypothetical protein [Brucella pseudogrignonensis]
MGETSPLIGEATAFPGHRVLIPGQRRSVKGSGQNKTEGSGVSLKAVFFDDKRLAALAPFTDRLSMAGAVSACMLWHSIFAAGA